MASMMKPVKLSISCLYTCLETGSGPLAPSLSPSQGETGPCWLRAALRGGWFRRISAGILALWIAFAVSPLTARADAILSECSQPALEAGLGVGGLLTVNCDGTLVLSNALFISNDAIIDASVHSLVVSSLTVTNSTNASRFYYLIPGISV